MAIGMLTFAISCDVHSPLSHGPCMQAADQIMDARRSEMSPSPGLPGHSALLTYPESPPLQSLMTGGPQSGTPGRRSMFLRLRFPSL